MNKTNKSNSLPNTRCQPRISLSTKQFYNLGTHQEITDLVVFGNYTLNKKYILGKGFCSKVYKAINNQTKQKYAIKIIQLSQIKTSVEKRFLKNQIRYLKLFKNAKHVLNICQIITTQSKLAIVSQICKESIYQKLRPINGKEKVPLQRSEVLRIMNGLINGYIQMREHNLVHRDIKPANILINNKGEVKLADLGFCTHDDDIVEDRFINVGSPLYMAPQVLKGNHYGQKADVWAIGLVFLQMMIADLPWKNCKQTQLRSSILKQNIPSLVPSDLSPQYRQVLIKSLQFNPQDRISISQMKKIFKKQYQKSFIQIDNLISKKTIKLFRKNLIDNININQSAQLQKNKKLNFNLIKQKFTSQYCSHNSLKQLIKQKRNNINFQNIEGSQKIIGLKLKLNKDKQKRTQTSYISTIYHQQMNKFHFCRFLFKIIELILNNHQNINFSYYQFDQGFIELIAQFIVLLIDQIKNVTGYTQKKIEEIKNYKKSVEFVKVMNLITKYQKNYKEFFYIKFKEEITSNNIEISYLLQKITTFIKNASNHLQIMREELFESSLEILMDEEMNKFARLMHYLLILKEKLRRAKDGRDGYNKDSGIEKLLKSNADKIEMSLEQFNAICKMAQS